MINGNTEDFINKLYYGEEMYLIYNNNYIFISSWFDNGIKTIRMLDYDFTKKDSIYNFEISSKNKDKVIKEFLNKKIWNGKTFYEECKNIEWSEPFDPIVSKD